MAVKTALEQLEEVQTAISLIMSGQEIGTGNKRLRMADLGQLEAREKRLLEKYRQETGTSAPVKNYMMLKRS